MATRGLAIARRGSGRVKSPPKSLPGSTLTLLLRRLRGFRASRRDRHASGCITARACERSPHSARNVMTNACTMIGSTNLANWA